MPLKTGGQGVRVIYSLKSNQLRCSVSSMKSMERETKITLEEPGLPPPLTVRHAPFDWAAQCICWWLEDAFSTCLCHVQPEPWSRATSSSLPADPAPLLWLPSAAAAHPCAPASAFDSCQTLPCISWSTERCIDRNRNGGERWETVVTESNADSVRDACQPSEARPLLTPRWRADRRTYRWSWS